jgi:hypothetical protein
MTESFNNKRPGGNRVTDGWICHLCLPDHVHVVRIECDQIPIQTTKKDRIAGKCESAVHLAVGQRHAGRNRVRDHLQVIAYVKSLPDHSSEDHKPEASPLAIQVTGERLKAAGTRSNEWLTYSSSYNGWRHTSLPEITPGNVSQLRVRWVKQFDIKDPVIEATPLVVDGTMFMTLDGGHVLALE